MPLKVGEESLHALEERIQHLLLALVEHGDYFGLFVGVGVVGGEYALERTAFDFYGKVVDAGGVSMLYLAPYIGIESFGVYKYAV